jgi:hypothetical protein
MIAMDREQARTKLREILDPIRIHAEMGLAVPDVQDALRMVEVDSGPWSPDTWKDMEALARTQDSVSCRQ